NKTRHLNRGKIIHRHTPSRAHKIDTTPHVGACIEHRKKGLNCPIIPKALSGYTVVSEGVYEKIRQVRGSDRCRDRHSGVARKRRPMASSIRTNSSTPPRSRPSAPPSTK